MKIRTNYKRTEYITPGKIYKGYDVAENGTGCRIIDDVGDELYIHIPNSSHIGMTAWEIVDD